VRGQVDTPSALVDHMVEALFSGAAPSRDDRLLDPGCGEGAFISGVLRWCERHECEIPRITGVDSDPGRLAGAHERFVGIERVDLVEADYLADEALGGYRFIVGNPPYVGLPKLSNEEKRAYRGRYSSASGRFDLYFLFFERAIQQLRQGGRLAFVTPEKWLYVKAAANLRSLLGRQRVERIELHPEESFPNKATYPCVTVLSKAEPSVGTVCSRRDGETFWLDASDLRSHSWWPMIHGDDVDGEQTLPTLSDVTTRVSAGVATGADKIFVRKASDITRGLARYAYPTLAGRDLKTDLNHDPTTTPRDVMLVPYDTDGCLLPLSQLGQFARYLRKPETRARLETRSCAERKAWYAFHDSLPLDEILQPKLLCKDITSEPRFWVDWRGTIVPRHSVYYIIPRFANELDDLATWLNSEPVRDRLRARCQRAQNGALRLQADALRCLPLREAPDGLVANAAA